jgi:hypothetical protein
MNKEDKKDLPLGWDCVVTTAPFDFAQGASFIVEHSQNKKKVRSLSGVEVTQLEKAIITKQDYYE